MEYDGHLSAPAGRSEATLWRALRMLLRARAYEQTVVTEQQLRAAVLGAATPTPTPSAGL